MDIDENLQPGDVVHWREKPLYDLPSPLVIRKRRVHSNNLGYTVFLSTLDGKGIMSMAPLGFWPGWFTRDNFLTAVYKRKAHAHPAH